MEEPWLSGKVLSIQKGFGFVSPTVPLPAGFVQGRVFFHFSVKQGPYLKDGDDVLFQLDPARNTRPAAKIIKRADWSGQPRLQRQRKTQACSEAHQDQSQQQVAAQQQSREQTPSEKHVPPQQPYKTVSKQPKNKQNGNPEQARQMRTDFKSRITGRVVTISADKKFGFLHPLEDLPVGYPEQEDVFFKCDFVENGGLELQINDIIDFSLGTQDKTKPMAMSAKVERFQSRTSLEIESFINTLKSRCDQEDDDMYKYVSCDAVWQCLGDSKDMKDSTVVALLTILLRLQEKLHSMPHRYEHIIKAFSNTHFFNPWSGKLKILIEHEQKLRFVDNLKSIKDFLMIVLKCVPAKLSAITSLLRPLLSNDTSSMDHYLFRMLREMTRSVVADVEDMPWENLPLVPSGKELLMEGTCNLQPVRTSGAYDSVEQYMDVYFRLFREDCFSALKKGVRDFLSGNLDSRDMNVYHSVGLVGIHLTREDSGLAIALQVVPLRPVRNWASSSNLMFGNLLCLSVSGSFRDPIWATVVSRDVKLLTSKNIIIIELCTESNDISDSDAIIQLSHGSGRITMVESPTYYRAYQPVLKALQKMQPDDFPFQNHLVELDIAMQPPDYIDSTTTADTRILHQSTGHSAERLMDAIGQNAQDSTLDISQYKALCMALLNRVAVIQGPPGTGKTFIGIKLVELILSMSSAPKNPIVVLTYKNHALDEFLKDLVQKFPNKVARVGGRCKESILERCNLSTLRKEEKKSKALHILMSEKYREADERKPAVKHSARQLDQASQYSHKMLLQYATTEQVVSLLVGCNWKENKRYVIKHDKQKPITKQDVQRYVEAAMSLNSNICLFLLSSPTSDKDLSLQEILFKLVEEAMQLWYPNQATVQQVEISLGIFASFHLNSAIVQKKEDSTEELQLQDKNDIEDMERERLAAVSSKLLHNSDIVEFSSMQASSATPRLFSTSKHVMAQLPLAKLVNTADLWDLNDGDRVKFIQCLLLKQFDEPKQNFETALAHYQHVSASRNELDTQHSIEVLKSKQVIGMTITGASIHRNLLAALKPAIVIVEEAAEVLEPQLIAALSRSVQHLILIGDHKQLRPPVESFELIKEFHFDVSMMERLINNNIPSSTLQQQNRMRPEFSKLLLDIYPDLKDNEERVMCNPVPQCIDKSMYFWDHSSPESGGRSYWNEEEADRAVRLCLFFLQQGYTPKQITILGAYLGQTSLIRKKIREEEKQNVDLFPIELEDGDQESSEIRRQRVSIHTIDLYQGDENDIVIVSLVRSNKINKVGFLKLLNRRCVAQSRSRCGLYFIGNIDTVCSVGHWKRLVENMRAVNCVGPYITLMCPRHPFTTMKATNATGITLSSFCKIVCNEMKQCQNHRCTKFCQPTHSHAYCDVHVSFKYETCNHVGQKACSKPVSEMICTETCGKPMECQLHLCQQVCGDAHSHSYCVTRVEFTYSACGHSNTKHCSEKEEAIKCEKDVKINHPICGHLVSKQCFQEDSKARCKEPCIKALTCGHQCNNKCGHPCTQENDCKSCIKIKEEEERKRLEAEKKAIADFKAKLKAELEDLKKLPVPNVLRSVLVPEGDSAAEYYQVEDRVKKYVQLKHKWFPEVTKIEKVYNHQTYQRYLHESKGLKDPTNQTLLFHGTSKEAAESIIEQGFKIPKIAGMFGKGIYFATDSSKSAQDIYTKGSKLLLLCEVRLGKCKTMEKDQSHMDKRMLNLLGYDSLYAKRNTRDKGGVLFDEYVIYNPSQAIVKYIVYFECISIPEEHLENFNFFGMETSFCKHVLYATRGRQLQDTSHDTHFRIAESQFLRLTKERNLALTITEVHYYVNPPLVERFKQKADEFHSKYGKTEESEFIPAWHGTKIENIDKIVHENFRLDKLASATGDRGWYGAGIYFSEFPDVSLMYGSQILLCMVLPGKVYDAKLKDRNRLEGKPCEEGFDSHRIEADKQGRGEELVIFNPDQILPCYVINFKEDSVDKIRAI